MTGRVPAFLAAALLAAAPAAAHDVPPDSGKAAGCAAFRWPAEGARKALATAAAAPVEPGAERSADGTAFRLRLLPPAEARLVRPPERAPRQAASHAGALTLVAPAAGLYQIALTRAAWVDAIQADSFLKPLGFSGAPDCAGLRKLVRYRLEAGPFTLQLSDVSETSIDLVVEPVAE